MPNLGDALGARLPSGTLQITLFIPSVDRNQQPIDQGAWREDGLATLARLFRGATAFPPGRGAWRDDARGGTLVFDDAVLVTSYADAAALTDSALAELRNFLHRLGREARQGEVGVIIGGDYYGITEYDHD